MSGMKTTFHIARNGVWLNMNGDDLGPVFGHEYRRECRRQGRIPRGKKHRYSNGAAWVRHADRRRAGRRHRARHGLAAHTSEARGLDQALRNASHAQTAMGELVGKYADMGDTLQRLREITVQGANGTNSSTEFTYLNKEYDELLEHIEAIATPISSGFTLNFQTGASADDTFEFTIAKISVSDLGLQPSASAEGLSSTDAYTGHISKLDSALATVVERQAIIGAHINRLDYRMGHLATSSQSAKESLGRI